MGYRYVESGLDNVVLEGFDPTTTVEDEDGILIPRVGRLHRLIASALVGKFGPLDGRELRFLRVEIGATVTDFARSIGVEARALDDAEAGRAGLDSAAEQCLRRIVRDAFDFQATDVRRGAFGDTASIRIDASDPSHYRLLEAETAP